MKASFFGLKGLAGRILCKLGRHNRSRGRAKRTAEGWSSHCRRCDVPMTRSSGGRWVVVREEAPKH